MIAFGKSTALTIGLAMWLAISSFWGRLNNQAIVKHYQKMFRES